MASEFERLRAAVARDLVNLAQFMYEAYGYDARWKNVKGEPMPQWKDLPEEIRQHWEHVAYVTENRLLEERRAERAGGL